MLVAFRALSPVAYSRRALPLSHQIRAMASGACCSGGAAPAPSAAAAATAMGASTGAKLGQEAGGTDVLGSVQRYYGEVRWRHAASAAAVARNAQL